MEEFWQLKLASVLVASIIMTKAYYNSALCTLSLFLGLFKNQKKGPGIYFSQMHFVCKAHVKLYVHGCIK